MRHNESCCIKQQLRREHPNAISDGIKDCRLCPPDVDKTLRYGYKDDLSMFFDFMLAGLGFVIAVVVVLYVVLGLKEIVQ